MLDLTSTKFPSPWTTLVRTKFTLFFCPLSCDAFSSGNAIDSSLILVAFFSNSRERSKETESQTRRIGSSIAPGFWSRRKLRRQRFQNRRSLRGIWRWFRWLQRRRKRLIYLFLFFPSAFCGSDFCKTFSTVMMLRSIAENEPLNRFDQEFLFYVSNSFSSVRRLLRMKKTWKAGWVSLVKYRSTKISLFVKFMQEKEKNMGTVRCLYMETWFVFGFWDD